MINNVSIACKTDIGNRRPNNEDEVGFLDNKDFKVLLVCDGMGGHNCGEVASKMAKEMVLSMLDSNCEFTNQYHLKTTIKKIMKKANSAIHKLSSSKDEFNGMGTTLVMAIVLKEYTAIINCGDSRCYMLKDNKLVQITKDQTVVEYLYEIGAISKEEMKTSPKRHVLMNAMGISSSIDYDIEIIDSNYQGLLLCSDGLSNMVTDEDIEKMWVERLNNPTSSLCSDLVSKALVNGGIDNISVCVLEVR